MLLGEYMNFPKTSYCKQIHCPLGVDDNADTLLAVDIPILTGGKKDENITSFPEP